MILNKSLSKYILKQYGICSFFMTISLIAIMSICLILTLRGNEGAFGGIDSCSAITILVMGLIMFDKFFNLGIQNGVSRKNIYTTIIISLIGSCLLFSAADLVLVLTGKLFETTSAGFSFDSTYEQLNLITFNARGFLKFFNAQFHVNLAVSSLVLALAVFQYRAGFIAKIIFYIGIVLSFITLRLLDHVIFNNSILKFIGEKFLWTIESISHISIVCLATAIIFAALAFLIIRRTPVVEKKK